MRPALHVMLLLVLIVLAAAAPAAAQDAQGAAVTYLLRYQSSIRSGNPVLPPASDVRLSSRELKAVMRLQLLPISASGGANDYGAVLRFDSLGALFNGGNESLREEELLASSTVPFLLSLDDRGEIRHLAFDRTAAPAFRSLVKELAAALVIPYSGRDSAWSVSQPFPDGTYEVRYTRRGDATECGHTRTQRRLHAGFAMDSVLTDLQECCILEGDPLAGVLRAERSFIHTFSGSRIHVAKSLEAFRGAEPVLPSENLLSALRELRPSLHAEAVYRAYSAAERSESVSKAVLGTDDWASLKARLQRFDGDNDTLLALAAKFRSLLQLQPALGDSLRVLAAQAPHPSQRRLIFVAACEAESVEADVLICDLLAAARKRGEALEDLFVTLALRPRIPDCLPSQLLDMAISPGKPQDSYHAGLLLSALLRRVRKTEAGRADTLFQHLLAATKSLDSRIAFIGNHGRCKDIVMLTTVIDSGPAPLREASYHALRAMPCADADTLLAHGFLNDPSPQVRRRIAEVLTARPPIPSLLETLLRDITDTNSDRSLLEAEAELITVWYPSLGAGPQRRIRDACPAIPDQELRSRICRVYGE